MNDQSTAVLDYWFGELDDEVVPEKSRLWFEGGEVVDTYLKNNFKGLLEKAAGGKCDDWAVSPQGRLALIVLLDQFSRHIYRGTPKAFAQDTKALGVAREMVHLGEDQELFFFQRSFVYLPFEHSEDLRMQHDSIALFQKLADAAPDSTQSYFADNLRYAVRHREIIQRFGRFPHRNLILGRTSTPEEEAFLKEPMSSF
jgi:uncharacterized protein (DUF924 family)